MRSLCASPSQSHVVLSLATEIMPIVTGEYKLTRKAAPFLLFYGSGESSYQPVFSLYNGLE